MIYVHQVYDGAVLRQRREQLGLTQLDVARHCKVSTTSVGDWENNNRNPRTTNLFPLAKLLKLQLPGWLKATATPRDGELYRRKPLLKQHVDFVVQW